MKLRRAALQNKHRGTRAEHDENCDSDHDSRQPRTRLILHQLAVRRCDQNADEQKWREQAVNDRSPEKCFYRIDPGKIHSDAQQSGEDHHPVKIMPRLQGKIQAFSPMKSLGESVSGRSR